MPATSNAILSACGATVLVSRRPFKFHRRGYMIDRQGTILHCAVHGYVIMTCMNVLHYLKVKEERVVRGDCQDGLRTVYVCFMHNTKRIIIKRIF